MVDEGRYTTRNKVCMMSRLVTCVRHKQCQEYCNTICHSLQLLIFVPSNNHDSPGNDESQKDRDEPPRGEIMTSDIKLLIMASSSSPVLEGSRNIEVDVFNEECSKRHATISPSVRPPTASQSS